MTEQNDEASLVGYEEASAYYDAIYVAMKDYAAEAARIRSVLDAYARRPVCEVLDMACGTGLHDQYLREYYRVEGADLSPSQLAVARRRCTDLSFHRADMTAFDLGRDYDAVLCLFSSIGHVITEERLRAAVAAMARHVRPGGVLVIEPFIDPSDFFQGTSAWSRAATATPGLCASPTPNATGM